MTTKPKRILHNAHSVKVERRVRRQCAKHHEPIVHRYGCKECILNKGLPQSELFAIMMEIAICGASV